MEDMVQRFGPGEIQAVYAHNDEMALGAVTALEAAGRLGEVQMVGIDGQETAYEAIKNGKMAATFTCHFVAPEGVSTRTRSPMARRSRRRSCSRPSRSIPPTSTSSSAPASDGVRHTGTG